MSRKQKEEKPMEEKSNDGSVFSDEQEEKKMKEKLKATTSTPKAAAPAKSGSKWRDLKDRTLWTFIFIFSLVFCVFSGHFYCMLLNLGIIIRIFYELLHLPNYYERNKSIPNLISIAWGFFFIGTYFTLGITLMNYLEMYAKYKIVRFLISKHYFICFMLFCANFYRFFLNLKKGVMRYQIGNLGLFLCVFFMFIVPCALVVSNAYHAMIWYVLPITYIICNDISAYLAGRLFGKHQLTVISPKKTWEGYLGAVFLTLIYYYLITNAVLNHKSFLCPEREVTYVPGKMYNLNCDIKEFNDILFEYELGPFDFIFTRLHLHQLMLCLFACIYGPLGGLFASGFKRSIGVKDFSDIFAGHGGMTDRMDCQFIMGVFTYVYINTFVYNFSYSAENAIKSISLMSNGDKFLIYNYLKQGLSH